MVSTRGHPSTFPAPDLTPTKSASPSKVSPSKRITRSSMKEESPSESVALETRPRARSIATTWSHTPSTFTLVWLVVSLPLVIWDIGYMFGRPYTMPGGKWHWPLYSPYELYGRVDLTYGVHAYNTKEGWGPCQTAGNVIETLMYLGYLYIAYAYGQEQNAVGRGAPTNALSFGRRKIVGREAGIAVLLGFSAGLMTFWKTLLYWGIEYFNGWAGIGHNTLYHLVVIFIIPNAAWFVGSGYIIYVCGSEILQGLEIAGGLPYKKDI